MAYSFVDAANPIVFVSSRSIGIKGTETPAQYEALENIVRIKKRIEILRGTCAVTAGLAKDLEDARVNSPVLPKVAICSEPERVLKDEQGGTEADYADIVARFITLNGKMNPSFAGTAGICMAVAANTPGTIVHRILCAGQGEKVSFEKIRIAHPCGIMEIGAEFTGKEDGGKVLESCILGRTARKIMDGFVYICTD